MQERACHTVLLVMPGVTQHPDQARCGWMPACAGMTAEGDTDLDTPLLVGDAVPRKRKILDLGLGEGTVPVRVVATCIVIWLGFVLPAAAWGPVAHAVIGELVERYLLINDPGLQALLSRFREASQSRRVKAALLHVELPLPGEALRFFANWPDVQKRQPGMLPYDGLRHFVNLPHTARYNRAQHCPDGICSIETLLQQRAILANHQASLGQRAVALAWVIHLIGDIHQPLHAGKAEDRGGNLTCIVWKGQPSRLVSIDGKEQCSGANLHALWDSLILEEVTGFTHPNAAPALARQFQPLLQSIAATEPPLTARTEAAWRAVVERWHTEAQALILQAAIYPHGNTVERSYIDKHYGTIRQQVLHAAVRLAAMLRLTLQ